MTEVEARELVRLLKEKKRMGSYGFGNQWSLEYMPDRDAFFERVQAEDWPKPRTAWLTEDEVVAGFLKESFEKRRSQLL